MASVGVSPAGGCAFSGDIQTDRQTDEQDESEMLQTFCS